MADSIKVPIQPVIDNRKLKQQADHASKTMEKEFKEGGKKAGKSFSQGFKGGFGGAALGTIAIAGVQKLMASFDGLTEAAKIQEQAENKLGAAFRASGQDVITLLPKFKKFASEIQGMTTVGDEATLELLQLGTTMGITGDKLGDAAKGAIGLSKSLGIDLNSSMKMVALAGEGDFNMLQRYIPALKKTKDASEKAAIVQKALADGFKIAQAETETASGKNQQLANTIGDVEEKFGQIINEIKASFIPAMKPFIGILEFVAANAEALIPIFVGLGAVIATVLVPSIYLAVKAWIVANLAFLASPLGLILTGVVLLATGVILLAKNWDVVVEALMKAWEAIKDGLIWVGQLIGIIGEESDESAENTEVTKENTEAQKDNANAKGENADETNKLTAEQKRANSIIEEINQSIEDKTKKIGALRLAIAQTAKGTDTYKELVKKLNQVLGKTKEKAKETIPSLDALKKSYLSLENPLKVTFDQLLITTTAITAQKDEMKELNAEIFIASGQSLEKLNEGLVELAINAESGFIAEGLAKDVDLIKDNVDAVHDADEQIKDSKARMLETDHKIHDERLRLIEEEKEARINNARLATDAIIGFGQILTSAENQTFGERLKNLAVFLVDVISKELIARQATILLNLIEAAGTLNFVKVATATGAIIAIQAAAAGAKSLLGAEEGTDFTQSLFAHDTVATKKDTFPLWITPKEARYGILSDKALDVGGRLASNREIASLMNKGMPAEDIIIQRYESNKFNDRRIVGQQVETNRQLSILAEGQKDIVRKSQSMHTHKFIGLPKQTKIEEVEYYRM